MKAEYRPGGHAPLDVRAHQRHARRPGPRH